jgi:hypothetical protein
VENGPRGRKRESAREEYRTIEKMASLAVRLVIE